MKLPQTIEQWLGAGRGSPAGAHPPDAPCGVDREPPREGECRVIALDEVLAPHAALTDRVRVAYGGAEGGFDVQIAPLILRFAAFVHRLPATRDAHFRGAGGGLHCGLEVGLHAMQAADGQIFAARGSVPARRAAAPRWRAAAFATGLCSELHRPVFGTCVRADDGAQWLPLAMPLYEWLRHRGCDRYFVEWPDASVPQRATTLAILPALLGASLLDFLAAPDRTILDHVLAAIAAPPGTPPNALGAIVEQTLSRVVARELRRAPISDRVRAVLGVVEVVGPDGAAWGERLAVDDLFAADRPAEDAPAADPEPPLPAPNAEDASEVGSAPRRPTQDRRLALPATLNPMVAEALRTLLAPSTGGPPAAGVERLAEGIHVPLDLWTQCGLDTGLAVRSLHEARLLVPQGTHKIWRKRQGDAQVPGLMLDARLFA